MSDSGFWNRMFGRGGKSTDAFTQPITVNEAVINNGLGNMLSSLYATDKKIEDWVTTDNNEFEIFDTTPEVKLVINKGASLFSNGKWKLRDVKTGEDIEEHEILDLLKKPNPYQDKNLFLRGVYTSWGLYANSFSYLNYALESSLFPRTISNLNTPQIKLIRSGKYIKQDTLSQIIESIVLTDINDKRKNLDKFKLKEIVHFKDYNPSDQLLGSSRLRSLHMPISNIRAGRGYVNADYTKKGAMGILSPEAMKDGGGVLPVNAKHVEDLEKQYSETTHGTGDDQSKVIIAKMPIKYVSVSSAIKDHLIHEEIEISFKKIIDTYDLTEGLFSFAKQSTFSNQENGEKQAYQNGIIPLANQFSSALNDALDIVKKIGAYLVLDYSHVSCFQDDETEKAKELVAKVTAMEKLIAMGYTKEDAAEYAKLDD